MYIIDIERDYTCSDERLEPAGLSTLSSVCKYKIKIFAYYTNFNKIDT